MRESYWNYYTRTRFEMFYFYEYLNDSYRWLRSLEGFLAVASCGSIAAWAVWDDFYVVWAAVIAAAQVIAAVKQYLPYGKRIQALNNLLPRLDIMLNNIDHMWFRVDKNEFTDDQINDLIFSFKKECTDLSNKYLTGVFFPEREGLRKAAQIKTECFFESILCKGVRIENDSSAVASSLLEERKRNFAQVPSMMKPIPVPLENAKKTELKQV